MLVGIGHGVATLVRYAQGVRVERGFAIGAIIYIGETLGMRRKQYQRSPRWTRHWFRVVLMAEHYPEVAGNGRVTGSRRKKYFFQ
ncbi:MAG: hypothetical protein WBF53_04850 [Litorimonas sp.]